MNFVSACRALVRILSQHTYTCSILPQYALAQLVRGCCRFVVSCILNVYSMVILSKGQRSLHQESYVLNLQNFFFFSHAQCVALLLRDFFWRSPCDLCLVRLYVNIAHMFRSIFGSKMKTSERNFLFSESTICCPLSNSSLSRLLSLI